MKQKKSTIKFLRKSKAEKGAGKNGIKGKPKMRPRKERKPHSSAADDDDDADDESVDDPVVKKSSDVTKGGPKKHKEELEELATTDPEFYKFLQENDANLLDFDEDEESDNDDDIEEDFEEDNAADEERIQAKTGKKLLKLKSRSNIEVTESIIKNTVLLAKQGSHNAIRRLLLIFRAACIPNSVDSSNDQDDDNVGKFIIPDPQVYESVMSAVLESASESFCAVLGIKSTSSLIGTQIQQITTSSKFKKINSFIQSFFKSILHTLSGLAMSNDPGEVAMYIISSLEAYIPFLAELPKLTKKLLQVLLTIWSQNTPLSAESNCRIQAYLLIRQMCLLLPGSIAEECYRMMYLTLLRHSKSFSTMNSSSILFMMKCIVELYTTDVPLAYNQAFLYIRQLALLLRIAVMKKTAENSKKILNWQYLNGIRCWTKVICALNTKDELKDLAFPLSQIIFGILAAAPSSINIPLKFHLISCLHQLAAACQVFIPTSTKLLEILELPEFLSKPTPTTDLPPKLSHIIRFLPNACLKPNIRDMIISETLTLLQCDSEIYRYHVGFPEYIYLTIRKLRSFIKKSKINRWRDLAKSLVNQFELYSTNVKKMRLKLNKAPNEITDFEPLLEKGAENAITRLAKMNASRSAAEVNEVIVDSVSGNREEDSGDESIGDEEEEEEEEKKKVVAVKKKEKSRKGEKREAIKTKSSKISSSGNIDEDDMDVVEELNDDNWSGEEQADD